MKPTERRISAKTGMAHKPTLTDSATDRIFRIKHHLDTGTNPSVR